MASEIPEDIQAKADKVMASLSMHNPVIADAIAKALKAEREQCARIVEDKAQEPWERCILAAAVRQDNPNEQDERYRALAEMAKEAKKLGLE